MDSRVKRAYWQATALLLCAGYAGWQPAWPALVVLNVFQLAHFAWRRRCIRALDVQVRGFFLGILLAGMLPGGSVLHLAQFAGLNLLLVADYCLLARLLTLAPWNRTGPLTRPFVRAVLLTPPGPGSILERVSRAAGPAA